MNQLLNHRPAPTARPSSSSRPSNAPSWWHGDEAALVEARSFQNWQRGLTN